MQVKEINLLKENIKEARELLAYYQQELDKDPGDFAQQLRYNSFKGHLNVLENELSESEKEKEVLGKEAKVGMSDEQNDELDKEIIGLEAQFGQHMALAAINFRSIASATTNVGIECLRLTKETNRISTSPGSAAFQFKFGQVIGEFKNILESYAGEVDRESKLATHNLHKAINAKVLSVELCNTRGVDQSQTEVELVRLMAVIPKSMEQFKGFTDQISASHFLDIESLRLPIIKVVKAHNELLFTCLSIMNLTQELISRIK